MKRKHTNRADTLLAIMLVMTMIFCAVPVHAEVTGGNVAIDATNFPDAVFREYVQNFDTNKDGKLSAAERDAVTDIDLFRKFNSETHEFEGPIVTSLKGIEHFEKLQNLYCGNHDITNRM